jgi:CDP-diacylglycerol---serine O-phosphatidyltransferase
VLHFMNAANAITLLGACAGLAAAILAVQGKLPFALCAFAIAGLCDLFDGLVARKLTRTDEQKAFGARLDSLCDACVFGALPPFLFYAAGMTTPAELGVLAAFLCSAVWRLAYFDTVGLTDGSYRGLPTTFVALVVPLAFLAGFDGASTLRVAANASAAALAVAMVAPFKLPKPGGVFYVIFPLLAIGVVVTYLSLGGRYLPS